MQRSSTRLPSQSTPPGRRRQQGSWRIILGPMFFGLVAGILLTLGIISLLGAFRAPPSSPVASNGATVNANPTPTATPTATPLPTDTPLPTATPMPTAAPAGSSGQIFASDDPRFYIVAFLVFVIIAGFYLARKK